MKGFINPSALDGKNMVDAHLAIEKRHIIRFVNERRLDVVVIEDLIEAIKFNNGLPNTAVELIEINRNYHGLKSWLLEKRTSSTWLCC